MLNLHRDKKIVRREPGRDGKILSDHRQDGNDEVGPSAISEIKKKKKDYTNRRYFQHAHFIPKVETHIYWYLLVHGDLPRHHPFWNYLEIY